MRAYYSTHKSIRLFVLGVPEGWLVLLYDLRNQQWIDNTAFMQSTLGEAKIVAKQKAEAVIGKNLPDCTWH
jgi:hypothetical protein